MDYMLTTPMPPTLDVVPAFSQQVAAERRFTLGLQSLPNDGIQVVSGGWERCQSDYLIQRDSLPALAIELVTDGEGELTLGGTSYHLTPGTLFVYGPDVPHRIVTDPTKRLSKYFINTFGASASEALTKASLPFGTVLRVNDLPTVRSLFDGIIQAGISNSTHSASICNHLYQALLLTIVEHASPYGSNDRAGFATYQRCRSFIDENHNTVTTLEEVAQRCEVSAAYLCRLFQNYAQESPYQFLTRLRMQRAARLLESGLKAKDVAKQLGFADQFHFSRCFSRVFGLPPRRFIALSKPKNTTKS
jgi:AraC-like DNA-binding protein